MVKEVSFVHIGQLTFQHWDARIRLFIDFRVQVIKWRVVVNVVSPTTAYKIMVHAQYALITMDRFTIVITPVKPVHQKFSCLKKFGSLLRQYVCNPQALSYTMYLGVNTLKNPW